MNNENKHNLFTAVDEISHLKYLYAKGDVDDIHSAIILIFNKLRTIFPEFQFDSETCSIVYEKTSPDVLQIIRIKIIENQLYFGYSLWKPDLFSKNEESNLLLIKGMESEIEKLGFYKTGEEEKSLNALTWHSDIYTTKKPRIQYDS